MADDVRVLVLHGPNLNLLWRREPHIHGSVTLDDINTRLQELGSELGAELIIQQSNHEGALIDAFHAHNDNVDDALLNPGGRR